MSAVDYIYRLSRLYIVKGFSLINTLQKGDINLHKINITTNYSLLTTDYKTNFLKNDL